MNVKIAALVLAGALAGSQDLPHPDGPAAPQGTAARTVERGSISLIHLQQVPGPLATSPYISTHMPLRSSLLPGAAATPRG